MIRRLGTRSIIATVMRSAARSPVDPISVMLPAVESGRTPSMGALTLIERNTSVARVNM